jgi:hypothetical protein
MGDPVNDFFLDDPRKLDDPFADLAWLREHRPVHRHEPIGQAQPFSGTAPAVFEIPRLLVFMGG